MSSDPKPGPTSDDPVASLRASSCFTRVPSAPALGEQALVQLGGERVDLAGQLGVRLQLELRLHEVVVGLGLLEGGLTVLTDHHERRQEDRLQRHDQAQRRPRALLEREHLQREDGGVQVDEGHGPGEGRDLVRDLELEAGRSLRPHRPGDGVGVVRRPASHVPDATSTVPGVCPQADRGSTTSPRHPDRQGPCKQQSRRSAC